jgi:hypothetical protein
MQGYYESREGTEGVQRTATGRKIYHCDKCGRRKLKKELIRPELFDLPWHDKPRIAYFCREAPRDIQERAGVESCAELLTQHGWSDFRYFTCCVCDRIICEQHPGNGWHTQYRERGDEQICLRCYEKEILTEGIPREKFEEGHLEGMFFSGDNHELRDAGFVAVVDYAHVSGTASAKDLCKQAIELIDSGKLVVIGFESMAIGGLEGNISMWAKDAWLGCPECLLPNHYHGGDKLGNHLINEHHFTPAETVDMVKDAERVVIETEPEESNGQGSCQNCQKYKLDAFSATPEKITGICRIDETRRGSHY